MKKINSLILLCGLTASCSSDTSGTGTLHIEVGAEETVVDGLSPGTEDENIRDGWTVAYTKFYAVLGNTTASVSTDASNSHRDERVFVVDLRNLDSLRLAEFTDIDAVRYDRIGYDHPVANAQSICAPGTDEADCATVKSEGLSMWVAGSLTKDGTTKNFEFKIASGVRYSECSSADELLGAAVTTGAETQAEATMHGDHWFFTRFPVGDESTQPIYRCAGWLAAIDDADEDGVITKSDLMATSAVDAFPTTAVEGAPAECVFTLSGFPFGAVTTAWDYVVQQSMSLGHFDGEGDCARTAL